MRRLILAVMLIISPGHALRAEGLFQELPEPGKWCRYDTVVLANYEGTPSPVSEQSGELTVSALDVVEHNGRAYQWIEIEFASEVLTRDAGKAPIARTIYKFLVQRDQLQSGANPLAHVARAWNRESDGELQQVDVANFSSAEAGALVARLVLGEPLENRTQVGIPKRLTLGEEELVSEEGISGKMPSKKVGGGLKMGGQITLWPHESAGFGVLAAEHLYDVEITEEQNGVFTLTIAVQLELAEAGDGAVSKLPEQR